MKRPRVTTRNVADTYAAPNERIAEFTFPDGKGGLISFRDTWTPDPNDPNTTVHTRIVDLHRLDDGITILAPTEHTKLYKDK